MPVTSRFRLSLGGLAETDHETLRQLLADGEAAAGPRWDVADREYDAVIVDPDADDAAARLGDRPFGSLVILALRPGETAWPGTLSLARPFDPGQVNLTLGFAAQIVAQPAFSTQAPPAAPAPALDTSADLEESVEAAEADAPLYVAAVEEAAAIEESQAIETAALEAAEQADEDASQIEATVAGADGPAAEAPTAPELASFVMTAADDAAADEATGGDDDETAAVAGPRDANPFETVALSELGDEALDRLALDALGEPGQAEDADAELDPMIAPVVELQNEAGETLDLLSFPSPDDIDPLDIAIARIESSAYSRPEAAREPEAEAASEPELAAAREAEAASEPELEAAREPELEAAPEPEPDEPPVADELPAEGPALEDVDSLLALAVAYREQLYRERHVVVSIGQDVFHLEPYTGECYSRSRPEELARHRGRRGLDVRIEVRQEPADHRPDLPWRLVDFLWHLGFHAGDSRLLPWVDAEARYRITRQPPLGEDAKRSGALQIAQVLSRSSVAVADIARLADVPEATVVDFLNGCSLVGFLERVATPARRPPRHSGEAPDSPGDGASLMGSLRRRIGLSGDRH
jgi:hypothetical protein